MTNLDNSSPAGTHPAVRLPDGSFHTPVGPAARATFRLTGRSAPLDPRDVPIRRDLADIALADRVFAQHYAEPIAYFVHVATAIRLAPAHDADIALTLAAGERFLVLDLGRDWAWGRTDRPCSVGYVDLACLKEARASADDLMTAPAR